MQPFVDDGTFKDKVVLKKNNIFFFNAYVDDNDSGITKYKYIVEKIKNKFYYRFWNDRLPTLQKYYEIKKQPTISKVTKEEKISKAEYINNKRLEAIRKQHIENEVQTNAWLLSPLSIKLYGDKNLYNPNFSDEENAAMYYCSEWSRKCVTFYNESIFETCRRIYDVDLNKLRKQMNKSSVKSTKGQTYTWYIIQPFIKEKITNKIHYFPKTIVRALKDDNITRRFRITPEIQDMYDFIIDDNILGTYPNYKSAKNDYNNLEEKEIDNDFIKDNEFNFIKYDVQGYWTNDGWHNVSDEEIILEEVNRRISNLRNAGIYKEELYEDIYNAVCEKFMKKYNVEMYLKNISKCYKMFQRENKISAPLVKESLMKLMTSLNNS